MKKIIDISPTISELTPVWPGDISFSKQTQMAFKNGHHLDLASIHSTVHIGAHADAPSHYMAQGASIDGVELTPYLGPCLVIEVLGAQRIERMHCLHSAALFQKNPRVLFKTKTFDHHATFNPSFCFFTTEALEYLNECNVILVGIDTPSVDDFSSKDLPCHQVLARTGMRNLEGLNLDHVKAGEYELIALPLKLQGLDASPVRAVLRTI